MSKVTVSVASRLTGKSRETINTACIDGKLSSSKNEQGVRVIDVSELARLYPLVKTMEEITKSEPVNESQVPSDLPSNLREQVAVLKVQLQSTEKERDMIKAERERERRQLEDQNETLQKALERAQEQHSKAMLLITDQSQTGQHRDVEQEKAVRELAATVAKLQGQNRRIYRELQEQKKRGFWKWLSGGGQSAEGKSPQEQQVTKTA